LLFCVEGRKDYRQVLAPLMPLSFVLKKLESMNEKTSEHATPETTSSESKSYKRLLKNVQSDLQESEDWLQKNQEAIRYFLDNPAQWGAALEKDSEQAEFLNNWIKSDLLKIKNLTFKSSNRKDALIELKKVLARMIRKQIQAKKRLLDLESDKGRQIEELKRNRKDKAELGEASFSENKKTTLGYKVELSSGIVAIVGRRATENDELYRQAQSRDMWFHVRGQKGGHLWIRRGQKAFGAKSELSIADLEEGALLCAKYSKAKGSWISVDYTERRHLKKRKGGAPGELLVLQSKTLFVNL